MTPPALAVSRLTVAYRSAPVLWDVSLAVSPGRLVGVVGPNGAGKTTLLKAALGLVPKLAGTVRVLGEPYSPRRQSVAYVPQRGSVDWDFPIDVQRLVLMGSYGRLGWFRPAGRAEWGAVAGALDQVGLSDLASRQIGELSGGQQQRAFLARALVQAAPVYFLDEPFQGVDAVSERAVIGILRGLRDAGKTIVVVHHDLQTAADYFDEVVLLNVRKVAHGLSAEVLTPGNLARAYHAPAPIGAGTGRGPV